MCFKLACTVGTSYTWLGLCVKTTDEPSMTANAYTLSWSSDNKYANKGFLRVQVNACICFIAPGRLIYGNLVYADGSDVPAKHRTTGKMYLSHFIILHCMPLGQQQLQSSMESFSCNVWSAVGGSSAECSQLEHALSRKGGTLLALLQHITLALKIPLVNSYLKLLLVGTAGPCHDTSYSKAEGCRQVQQSNADSGCQQALTDHWHDNTAGCRDVFRQSRCCIISNLSQIQC